jgi:hypothetical protein
VPAPLASLRGTNVLPAHVRNRAWKGRAVACQGAMQCQGASTRFNTSGSDFLNAWKETLVAIPQRYNSLAMQITKCVFDTDYEMYMRSLVVHMRVALLTVNVFLHVCTFQFQN